PGWTVLYPQKEEDRKDDEQDLPEFRAGESGPHEPFVRRGETTPPKPFTESTLLRAMETARKLVTNEQLKQALKARGLGTPATRAQIIETLLARGSTLLLNKAPDKMDRMHMNAAMGRARLRHTKKLTAECESNIKLAARGNNDHTHNIAKIVP